MSEAPYFKPHEEGPIFPDKGNDLVDDVETFLSATNRDVEADVARQNIRDMSDDSFGLWVRETLKDMGITPPEA